MIRLNKKRLFYCIMISLILNGLFFLKQLIDHQKFTKEGIISVLNVKSLNKQEATFFQRAKYTHVAKFFFVTNQGDTIYGIRKNTWAMGANLTDEFENLPLYLPLDSVIFKRQNPKDYQLISEYKNYSIIYSSIAYFLIGPLIFTIWLYFLVYFIKDKMYEGYIKKRKMFSQ